MHHRNWKLLPALLGVLAGFAICAGASEAASGPLPKSSGGQNVTQVASGLGTPTSFAFGDGSVFEGDGGNTMSGPPNGGVFLLKNGTGTKLAGSPNFVGGLAWHQGSLYVSAGTVTATGFKFQLLRWSGWNGSAFTSQKSIFTAPKKFAGFNGIAFGPDGRLYVGAGVGPQQKFDHNPASAAPDLYDILSLNSSGRGLKVYATGIRQPWQMVFRNGSKAPLVSDLGQDSGAKNPPDFLLKVSKGQKYGFPKCNWLAASKCRAFAKPYKFFLPHFDPMGLAIIGSKLYITSFQGLSGNGSGEVFSMPVKGGAVKPFLTGFVAPIVGLGENAGTLYVGELTGQVFSVRP